MRLFLGIVLLPQILRHLQIRRKKQLRSGSRFARDPYILAHPLNFESTHPNLVQINRQPGQRSKLKVEGRCSRTSRSELQDSERIFGPARPATQPCSWSKTVLSTREHNYGNVCWWAPGMLHQKDRLSLEVHIHSGILMPTSPSGAGGAALSALSLLLDDDRHHLRRRCAHPGPPRSAHTLP